MKNTYLVGYFPLLSIMSYSLSFAVFSEGKAIAFLRSNGLYSGMLEFYSDTGIKFSMLVLFFMIFFMLFAAFKLIADTIMELSLLFFSKDASGENLQHLRGASVVYFIGGGISLFCYGSILALAISFAGTTIIAFVFSLLKISSSLSMAGLVGIIFFQVITWSVLIVGIFYSIIQLYNSIIAGLPI